MIRIEQSITDTTKKTDEQAHKEPYPALPKDAQRTGGFGEDKERSESTHLYNSTNVLKQQVSDRTVKD